MGERRERGHRFEREKENPPPFFFLHLPVNYERRREGNVRLTGCDRSTTPVSLFAPKAAFVVLFEAPSSHLPLTFVPLALYFPSFSSSALPVSLSVVLYTAVVPSTQGFHLPRPELKHLFLRQLSSSPSSDSTAVAGQWMDS